jgi:hypothetical protein
LDHFWISIDSAWCSPIRWQYRSRRQTAFHRRRRRYWPNREGPRARGRREECHRLSGVELLTRTFEGICSGHWDRNRMHPAANRRIEYSPSEWAPSWIRRQLGLLQRVWLRGPRWPHNYSPQRREFVRGFLRFSFTLLIFHLVGLTPAAGQCGELLQEAGLVKGPRTRKVVSQEPLHRVDSQYSLTFWSGVLFWFTRSPSRIHLSP